jgi:glycosyltransferase involved in cell wall biosynthesis
LSQSGNYIEKIHDLAAELPPVRLCGTFSPDEMGKVLQDADVLVLPAVWYENEPLVVKAALYCHIPVLASKIGSLEEMIEDGKTGWLLPPGDQEAWRNFLDELTPDQLIWQEGTYKVSGMDEHFQHINALYLAEI